MTNQANSDQKHIRWGIIGCGNVTEIKSGPAYQQVEGFELLAVMRRDLIKAKDYAYRHKVQKYYSDADDLIQDPDIDAIYIATPPDSHKFYGLKVAEAGKICCIEKPLAPNYNDSLEIVNAFQKKEIPLFVAYYRRSLPRFLEVKSWIDQKLIGEIRHISWNLSKSANDLDLSGRSNWRTRASIAPGGYFDDLASHGFDLFNYLLGDIVKAAGISLNQQNLYTAKDAISACWLHDKGITGSGFWNFGARQREDHVKIIGSEGQIEFSVFDEEPLKLLSKSEEKEIFIDNPKHIQFYHVDNMKRHLSNENFAHPSTGITACHANWVMDQILNN